MKAALWTIAALGAGLALTACQTTKSEIVRYTSADVSTRFVLSNRKLRSDFPVELHGKLFLPEAEGSVPVVVWVHPTTFNNPTLAGWRYNLRNELAKEGIGIFFADSYTGRGLGKRNTGRGSNTVSRYVDAMRALMALADHPGIDPERIGIAGASFGANVAMRLTYESFAAQVLPDGLRYAAHVAFYPPCSAVIRNYESTGAPMLVLIGDKDYGDYKRCEDRVEERRQTGAQADIVVYPGAYHGFISSQPVKLSRTPVYRDCGIRTLDKERGVLEMKFGSTKGMTIGALYRRRNESGCIEPEGYVGGNWAATKDALQRTVAFFAEHLK